MKADLLAIGTICLLVTATALLAVRHAATRTQESSRQPVVSREPREITAEVHLSELDVNKGPGWVFGRVMGVSNAPGTGTFSPYGALRVPHRR